MKNSIAITIGICISWISKIVGFGAGATWPGEIALKIDPNILTKLLRRIKKGIIIVAGTNGKTTTSSLIYKILSDNGHSVLHNESGANLLNGIVSSFFSDSRSSFDYAVFEVDENVLPVIISEFRIQNSEFRQRIYVILLNLFRDQLDRYGEVDTVAKKWLDVLKALDKNTTVLINADDPHLAFIGKNIKANVSYFGIQDPKYYLPKMQHATDTIFCPSCGNRLAFEGVYFSHLGRWACDKCGFAHPLETLKASEVTSPLEGVYNIYNTLAATLISHVLGISKDFTKKSVSAFIPAFGRMEKVIVNGKNITILLSKNPTGFNESLRTVLSSKNKGPLMLLLNDRIPDGTDVSWIWDVDFEVLNDERLPSSGIAGLRRASKIIVSGDRYLDMAVRLKYALTKLNIKNKISNIQIKYQKYEMQGNLKKAVEQFVDKINNGETGWILATYSAMLDVRKILTGKKIL